MYSMRTRWSYPTLLLIVWLIGTETLWSQDPIFSQFFNTPLYSNPASLGMDGSITATAAYRNQWSKVPGGFTTKYLSVESFEPCLPGAVGMSVWQDTEGEGVLKTTAAGLHFAFIAIAETRKTVHNFRFGMNPYWMQKEIDWERLVFSDQLDPRFGNINATAFDQFGSPSVNFGGLNFGFIHRMDISNRGKDDTQISYGLAFNNLLNFSLNTGPIESLQGLETALPMRMVAHASFYLPFLKIGNKIEVFRMVPQVRVVRQGGLTGVTLGAYGIYQGGTLGLFYHNRTPVAGFQNTDALTAYLGLGVDVGKRQALDIGLSYDMNIGGLRTMSGGVFEISLRYHIFNNGLLCGMLGSGGPGSNGRIRSRGKKRGVHCPPVGRSHAKRWGNVWYRNKK